MRLKEWARRWLGVTAVPAAKDSRGFSAAVMNRLTFSLAQSSLSVNSDLDSSLVIMRARARALAANNEFGKRFLSLVANNVVGPCGPTLQVRRIDPAGVLDKSVNDAVETHWARFCRRCDVTGRLSFPLALRIMVKGTARDGEGLARSVRSGEYPYGIAMQLLEADRLDEALNQTLQGGNLIRMGVELNSALKPLAYHVFERHPGENFMTSQPRYRERVPASDLHHLFVPERAEQVRGYSWFHAVLLRANMLAGYEEAAIVAARVGAAKMGAFTRSENATDGLDQIADAKVNGGLQMQAEAGEFLDLTGLPGVKLESWNPEYPHQNFESFVNQCLRGLAMGFDVAPHNLSGNMNEVNFSSARIAELTEREMWMALQNWLIDSFVFPFFAEWLNVALLRRAITFPKSGKPVPENLWRDIVDAATFQGRRWSWVDPLKEVQASRELIAEGLESRHAIAAAQGRDFDDIVAELGEEQKLFKDNGVNLVPAAPKSAKKPAGDQTDEAAAND